MKTKILISIITAGIFGTLTDVNGGDTRMTPAVPATRSPQAPTALIVSSSGAPAPPTGFTVVATPPAALAAMPADSPGGYYTNGNVCGYYINVNSPYWTTNESYGDLVYRHTTNSLTASANPSKTGTNPHEISKNVTAAR